MKPIIVYNEYMLIKKRGGTQWEAFRSLKGSPVIVRAQFTPSGIESGHVPTQVLINRSN